MSLIKHTSARAAAIARPFAFQRNRRQSDLIPDESAAAPVTERAEPDWADQIARLSEQLAVARTQIELARAEGEAKGYEQGLKDAVVRDEERIALLASSARDAVAGLNEKLAADGELAIEIGRAAVAAVVGDETAYEGLVTATARKWTLALKASAIVTLRVSSHDFQTPGSVETLRKAAPGVEIAVEQDLPAGSCLFDLELGQVDVSIPGQAARADEFLAQHAALRAVAP